MVWWKQRARDLLKAATGDELALGVNEAEFLYELGWRYVFTDISEPQIKWLQKIWNGYHPQISIQPTSSPAVLYTEHLRQINERLRMIEDCVLPHIQPSQCVNQTPGQQFAAVMELERKVLDLIREVEKQGIKIDSMGRDNKAHIEQTIKLQDRVRNLERWPV